METSVNVDLPEELHECMKILAIRRKMTVKTLYAVAAVELLKAAGETLSSVIIDAVSGNKIESQQEPRS